MYQKNGWIQKLGETHTNLEILERGSLPKWLQHDAFKQHWILEHVKSINTYKASLCMVTMDLLCHLVDS